MKLTFRDSYWLLTSSLDKQGKALLNESKKYFPYDFINVSDLNYIGEVPSKELFNGISDLEYQTYKKSFKLWSLKEETIKYCESDVILLHKIIRKFSSIIYNRFELDILKYPTLPSLHFQIYRSNFFNSLWNVPLILKDLF